MISPNEDSGNGDMPRYILRFLASKSLSTVSILSFITFYMWIIIRSYHSVFLSGLIITIYLAVELTISIPVGHLIDRINNTFLNFISTFFIFGSFFLLIISKELIVIYAITIIAVFGQTIKIDSSSGILKKHIPESEYKKANSINFGLNSVSSLTGTLLGGVSIILLPEYFQYVLLALAFLSIITSYPVYEKKFQNPGDRNSIIGEMKEAGTVLKKIASLLILAFFLNGLFISLDTYSPGLFHIVMKASPLYYTLFNMAVPIGMIAGTPIAGLKFFKNDKPILLSLLLLLFSPMILFISINRNPFLDIVDAFAIGLILPLINIPISTKLMKSIPYNIYGKVMAFLKIFTQGASPMMGAVFSVLAIFLPIILVLFGVGLLIIPLTIYGLIALPKFFKNESEIHDNSPS